TRSKRDWSSDVCSSDLYQGARGARFQIFPGSGLFKKGPDFVMSAELVETSRLWARTVAWADPDWVVDVAGDLVKRTYAEPRWSEIGRASWRGGGRRAGG